MRAIYGKVQQNLPEETLSTPDGFRVGISPGGKTSLAPAAKQVIKAEAQ